jgi:flagellar hook-associated protein 1 FlgK
MPSTFHGIEMGKRSLHAHTQALHTTGHNLNNLNTEGYSRQVVHMQAFEPLYVPDLTREDRPGQLGQGGVTASIERIRDALVDNRLIFEGKDLGYYDIRNKYLKQMELVYAEPSASNDPSLVNTLRTSFNDFMSSWQDLGNHPDEQSARIVLVEKANVLSNSIRHHYGQMTDIRNNVEMEVQHTVREINQLAEKIASLNDRILRVETVGDNPNDLLDERDRLIDKLSRLADIQISREDPDEMIIYIGGRHLVQGQEYETLALRPQAENDGYSDVFWRDGEKLAIRGGQLAGLVELRDNDLWIEVKKIDSFAANVTDLVNEIHREGFGANRSTGNDFFVEFPFTTDPSGNFDANQDGVDDSTYLFRVSGSNKLALNDKLGIRGQMNINGFAVNYFETDTVDDVVKRINESGARVNAFLNPKGKLTIKADYSVDPDQPDFTIQRLEDDGLFLTGFAGMLNGSGAAGAFDAAQPGQANQLTVDSQWSVAPLVHPSAYMQVNPQILSDSSYIAAASGIDTDGDGVNDQSNGVGDSSNALQIASLKHERVMIGMSLTVDQYFESIIADVGSRGYLAEKGFAASEVIVQNLENIRQSVSGVNIDEEFANMIKFQHGYNATAKIMTEFDKMIETLIFRLGA